jgi:hypothetical protein
MSSVKSSNKSSSSSSGLVGKPAAKSKNAASSSSSASQAAASSSAAHDDNPDRLYEPYAEACKNITSREYNRALFMIHSHCKARKGALSVMSMIQGSLAELLGKLAAENARASNRKTLNQDDAMFAINAIFGNDIRVSADTDAIIQMRRQMAATGPQGAKDASLVFAGIGRLIRVTEPKEGEGQDEHTESVARPKKGKKRSAADGEGTEAAEKPEASEGKRRKKSPAERKKRHEEEEKDGGAESSGAPKKGGGKARGGSKKGSASSRAKREPSPAPQEAAEPAEDDGAVEPADDEEGGYYDDNTQ